MTLHDHAQLCSHPLSTRFQSYQEIINFKNVED